MEASQGPWTCAACTFSNGNGFGLACEMCFTERRASSQSSPPQNDGGESTAAVLNEGSADNSALGGKDSHGVRKALPTAMQGDDYRSRQCDEPGGVDTSARQSHGGAGAVAEQQAGAADTAAAPGNAAKNNGKAAGGGKKRWDAFASLEDNLESSEDDDSDDGSGDDGSGDGSSGEGSGSEIDDSDRKMGTDGAGSGGWDAFKSLEQNYESSEDEYDSSSEEEAEFSDGENAELGEDHPSHDNLEGKMPATKRKPSPECVDLMDSDEDGSESELEVVEMPGKENNKSERRRSSRKRSGTKYEPYTIDGGSDSELSEVESSRPLPSPSSRPLPPWQRRKSTPGSLGTAGNLKGRDSFACMSSRSDVLGGAGAGVNGFQMAKRKGDDAEGATTRRKPRKTSESASASAASSTRAKKSTSSTSAKAKTTRKRRKTTTKAASKAPAKRRRKRTYRRSNNTRGGSRRGRGGARTGGRANSNNAWSARERGVRQRRGGGGESAPYMNIAKQEPMLANVGGSSIQF